MPIANIGRGVTPFNVVPIDFIVDSMVALAGSAEAIGETVHLCDPDPLSSAEMVSVLSELFAQRKPAYRMPPRGVAAALRFAPVREFYGGTPAQSVRYLNHPSTTTPGAPARCSPRPASGVRASASTRRRWSTSSAATRTIRRWRRRPRNPRPPDG